MAAELKVAQERVRHEALSILQEFYQDKNPSRLSGVERLVMQHKGPIENLLDKASSALCSIPPYHFTEAKEHPQNVRRKCAERYIVCCL